MPLPSQYHEQLAMIEAQSAFGRIGYATSTVCKSTKIGASTHVACQVQIWDIVIHLAEDVELLSLPGRFRAPTVVYFLSR
jgi:hypothetical protein